MVMIGSFPGRPDFKGLGELTPEEFGPLIDAREPVSPSQFDLAARAWSAFRSSTPEALDDLRHGDTAPLPFLAPALERFLQEYPWTIDGLSRSERRLLSIAGDGPISLSKAFPLMQDGEHAYYITDLSCIGLSESMSRATPPLLEVQAGTGLDHPLNRMVSTTAFGRSLLERRSDMVRSCGIDRWLGGVHLTGAPDWRWDDDRKRITR
jgi:hypothetical protein